MKEFNYYADELIPVTKRHSKEFISILESASPYSAIRAITHSKPLMVFWVSPEGRIIDAKDAHHDNPPHGDRSILANPTHKGYLRGRSAMIGSVLYVVIYGDNRDKSLTVKQLRLLKSSRDKLLSTLREHGALQASIDTAQFIREDGKDIII